MRMFVGVTDNIWYYFLKKLQPDEVNFWQPKSTRNFSAIKQGELFLFKLHSPLNFIVGGGVFVRQSFLPVSLTWDVFEEKNGTGSIDDFKERIIKYSYNTTPSHSDPLVSSLILTTPFFFEETDWISVPQSWANSIVQGKTYDTDTIDGRQLFDEIQERIAFKCITEQKNRYGELQTIVPRLGQGGFRVIVTEAYHRRCAITGEKTLPVLNASHIKPYTKEGPHLASNGLLLRQDIHTLFDRGYITINEKNIIEVSRRIKDDYGNGKEYYAYHGNILRNIPDQTEERPSHEFLLWHNENVYVG